MATDVLTLRLDGLKLLSRVIDPAYLHAHLQAALMDGVNIILDTPGVRNYPPQSEANTPGRFSIRTHRPMGYYVRGQGWMQPVMRKGPVGPRMTETVRVAGIRAGLDSKMVEKHAGVAGYKLRATSENYGKQFYVRPGTRNAYGVSVVLGNSASYAPYVGFNLQARIMAKRGWRRVSDVAEEKGKEIANLAQDRVEYIFSEAFG